MTIKKEEMVSIFNEYLNKFKTFVNEKTNSLQNKRNHCGFDFEVREEDELYSIDVVCPGYSTSNVKFFPDHVSIGFEDEDRILQQLPHDFFTHYNISTATANLKDGILSIRATANPEYFENKQDEFDDGYQEVIKEFELTSGKGSN